MHDPTPPMPDPTPVWTQNRHGKIIADVVSGYDHGNYIFRMFSQSKPVTAAATMILVDDGAIGLDDPVVRAFVGVGRGGRLILYYTCVGPNPTKPQRQRL